MDKKENKFTKFITELFMGTETKVDVEVKEDVVEEVKLEDEPSTEELKDTIEEVVEVVAAEVEKAYVTEDEVKELISETVAQTLEAIKLSKEDNTKTIEGLVKENESLKLTVEAIQLELQKPSKKATVVIPAVKKGDESDNWSMAGSVKK